MKLPTKVTLGLISTVFAASLAMAADDDAKISKQGHDMHCDNMSTMQGDMGKNPEASAQKHLAELKTTLNLTQEQQAAWESFSAQVNEQAKNMVDMQGKMKDMSQTAPEQMATMAAMMKTRADNMAKMADAVKTFYANLTPEQQKVFDKMHKEQMEHMHHKGHQK